MDGPREARPASGHCFVHRALRVWFGGFRPEHRNLVNLTSILFRPMPIMVKFQ